MHTCAEQRKQSSERVALTWEEFVDGEPCRGCNRPWDASKPLSKRTERAFAAAHAGGGRHGLAGSEIEHCLTCCAPPPLSPETIDRLVALLHGMRRRRT